MPSPQLYLLVLAIPCIELSLYYLIQMEKDRWGDLPSCLTVRACCCHTKECSYGREKFIQAILYGYFMPAQYHYDYSTKRQPSFPRKILFSYSIGSHRFFFADFLFHFLYDCFVFLSIFALLNNRFHLTYLIFKLLSTFFLNLTPLGSSGGAGAIIAAGGSPFDIGSDTGGSIRAPAHFNGIAGIKPTSGRVPRTGHIVPFGMGAVDALTQLGPMARYVEDLTLTLPVIAGVDWSDPAVVPMPLGDPREVSMQGLRVALHTHNGIMAPTPETAQAVHKAGTMLAEAGALVYEDRPAVLERTADLSNSLSASDGRAWVRRLLQHAGTTEIHPWIQRRIAESKPLSVAEFTALLEEVDQFRSAMLSFMEQYDVILCPVCAFPAPPHGTTMSEEMRKGFSYTGAYNLTGWPGAVVRGGTSPEGLPIGVQVVARPWREDVALTVAQHLETALGGWQRPQPSERPTTSQGYSKRRCKSTGAVVCLTQGASKAHLLPLGPENTVRDRKRNVLCRMRKFLRRFRQSYGWR
jgi:amidase